MQPDMSNSENKRGGKRDDETPAFRFVHVTDPLDTRNADIRKEVRAHVTRRQHRIARLKESSHNDAASGSYRRDTSSLAAPAPPPPPPSPLPTTVDPSDSSREQRNTTKRRRSASRLRRHRVRGAETAAAGRHVSSGRLHVDQASDPHAHLQVDLQRQSSSTPAPNSEHDLIRSLSSPKELVRAAPLASKTSRMSLLNDPNDQIASMLGRLRMNFPAVMVGLLRL